MKISAMIIAEIAKNIILCLRLNLFFELFIVVVISITITKYMATTMAGNGVFCQPNTPTKVPPYLKKFCKNVSIKVMLKLIGFCMTALSWVCGFTPSIKFPHIKSYCVVKCFHAIIRRRFNIAIIEKNVINLLSPPSFLGGISENNKKKGKYVFFEAAIINVKNPRNKMCPIFKYFFSNIILKIRATKKSVIEFVKTSALVEIPSYKFIGSNAIKKNKGFRIGVIFIASQDSSRKNEKLDILAR